MQRRQIILEDGRYLIFYTFEGEAVSPAAAEAAGTPQPIEPEARPEAEEERRV
ncbi:MAG: hypothetical protein M3Q76_13615 [Acidobacteriota bacterium]|nr:hypothetical protein [Acidobacteriota bacterium]